MQNFTVTELKSLCKTRCIKGYSKLTKKMLLDILNTDSNDNIINIDTSQSIIPIEITDNILPFKRELINLNTKYIVCKLCGLVGHNDKSQVCKMNIQTNDKIINHIIRNDTHNIKDMSVLYDKPQSYITEIIRNTPKIRIIKGRNLSIHILFTENIVECERCNNDIYHKSVARIWKDEKVCDKCWCEFEEEREQMWNMLNQISPQECYICSKKRVNTKMRFHYDHINMFDKDDSICSMINNGEDMQLIYNEMEKCRLICISCHSLITDIERMYGFTSYKTQLTKKLNQCQITQEEYTNDTESIEEIYRDKMSKVYQELREMYRM